MSVRYNKQQRLPFAPCPSLSSLSLPARRHDPTLMHLQRLQLYRFRNYDSQTLDFGPAANLIMGPNGQGKTNLLEAVTLLATSRSPRAGRDSELISWDATESRIWGEVARTVRPDVELEVRLGQEEGKRVFINKAAHSRVVDLIGQLNLVAFWVEDIEIARGDPSQRRRFLNTEICQVSPQYCYQLAGFRRVLEQRNKLLKQLSSRGTSLGGSLPVWDRQLIAYGAPLIERRKEFLERLQAPASEAHHAITEG
ncbi:MAG: DNA replication and repair protein RecF, partial [Armatimonadetes bacterium]|nr:DNA replication and repair protein RecF [Armatimonadota bacterium]